MLQEQAAHEHSTDLTLDQQKVGRLSRMDALQSAAMDQALEVRRRQQVQRIEGALQRLEEDEFGFCINCGEQIAPKRLEVDPSTANCRLCASGSPR